MIDELDLHLHPQWQRTIVESLRTAFPKIQFIASTHSPIPLLGAPNNSIQGGNNIAYVPPVDAVGEFKIMTNSYDAQYGRSGGGVMNVQIKSGGNAYHGSLYEFYRRNWLDSNYLFSNARGIPAGRFRNSAGEFVKAEHFLDQRRCEFLRAKPRRSL